MSDMKLTAVLRRMKRDTITVHGFRSSFRDWAGETTSHPREVIEHALAHQLKDKAEAAYQRGVLLQKRALLMNDWAKYCTLPADEGEKVVPINRKRKRKRSNCPKLAAERNCEARFLIALPTSALLVCMPATCKQRRTI